MLTWLLVSAACLAFQAPAAEADEAAYTRALEKRAADVLDELRLDDRAVADRVRGAIIDQYRGLRGLHDARDAKVRRDPGRGRPREGREGRPDRGRAGLDRGGGVVAERPLPRRGWPGT